VAVEKLLHFLQGYAIAGLDEDVRELVIDESPGAAGGQIELFAVGFFANLEEAGFAEDAVGIEDVIDWDDGVFAGNEPVDCLVVWLSGCLVAASTRAS
jgi:hypothetical protein